MIFKFLHSIPGWIAVFMMLIFASCSSPDESVDLGSMEGGLVLNVVTHVQTRAGLESLPDNEKMKSLRVVVLRENGTVEHNNTYTLLSGEDATKRIYIKVTPNEKKKVFLFANEESVDKLEFESSAVNPPTGTTLKSFFEQYSTGDSGFEDAVNNLYFAPDYSSGKAIPMSSMYEIEVGEGYVEKTLYLVRIATKFTINFENQRDTEVRLNSFAISSHADKNYLMAHVNDSDQNRQLFNGKSWIEWLKNVSDASSETDTEAAGWLKDYELPSKADLAKTYVNGEITVGAWSTVTSTPGKQQVEFYLPESKNIKVETSDGEQEYTMAVNIDGVSEPFVRVLPNLKALFRNTHVVINVTMKSLIDIQVEVRDWDSEEILTQFRDPIYLHVEKLQYPIVAGEVTEVWYKSDVGNVYVESPPYRFGGKDIPLYKYEKEYSAETQEGILKIYVNDSIPSSEYGRILTETDKYDFFHIVAESIHKRIKVTPLTLEYYLNVTPLSIPIDVSTRIASSIYEGVIPITIRTNYPNLKVALSESSGWSSIFADNSATAYLKLLSPDGTEVSLASPSSISVGPSESAIYKLAFKGLNTGSNIWKNKEFLELTVEGQDGNLKESIPVSVNIIPLVQDYVIHFKADGWRNPHIYVYECLEFPADWPGSYFPGNGKPEEFLASKPLGYYAGKENGEDAYYAALEYSYTGAIAFNGWDVPANLETLYYPNGSPRPFDGYKAQGFYIFNTDQDSWKPDVPDKSGIRYSYNMDFCGEHREDIKGLCPQCANTSMNRLWPGIRMKAEGDGWWKFTLTGIATPGKALIMFADGHSGDPTRRYPGPAEVGVPLFDYPAKEGWLRYNGIMQDRINNQFSSVKPAN